MAKKQPQERASAAIGWPTCGGGDKGVVGEAPAAAKVGIAVLLFV